MSRPASLVNGTQHQLQQQQSRNTSAAVRLLPELAHHIRAYMNSHQLACATRVCRAWYAIWTPYLWENVHYRVPHRCFPPLGKHCSWTRRFEGRCLTGGYPTKEELHRQSRTAVNRREKGGKSREGEVRPGTTMTGRCLYENHNSIAQPLLQQLDSLRLEGSHLQELSLFKTDITLDRLDSLLDALSQLKVFRFEVLNRIAPDYVPRSVETRPVGTWLGKSLGLLHDCEEALLGVISTRLRRLGSLELTFDASAHLHVGWVIFMLDALRHSLKALKLENCAFSGSYANARNNWNAMGFQKYVNRLLDDPTYIGCMSNSMLSDSSSMANTSPPPSEPISHSSSSSSLDDAAGIAATSSASPLSSSTQRSLLELAVASLTNSLGKVTMAENKLAPPTGLISLTLIRQMRFGITHGINDLLRECPNLEELNIHDATSPNDDTIATILEHNPKLTRLAFSKMPNISSQALERLFMGRRLEGNDSIAPSTFSSPLTNLHASAKKEQDITTPTMVPQLESVRLGYLHQSLTVPIKVLAEQHGHRLRRLSVHWCPTVATQDLWPILKKCDQLEGLALQLTKVTTKIFEDIPQDTIVQEGTGITVLEPKMHTWACASTLRRLDIGGPMFVDYSRYRERFLRPTVYHHLSPNPYLIGGSPSSMGNAVSGSSGSGGNSITDGGSSGSTGNGNSNLNSSSSGASSNTYAGGDGASTPPISLAISTLPSTPPPSTSSSSSSSSSSPPRSPVVGGHTTFNSSIVRIAAMFNNFVPPPNNHPHVERHWTDESLNPLFTLQTRIAAFPRLRELGLQTKGIEQWILKGFNHHYHNDSSSSSSSSRETTTAPVPRNNDNTIKIQTLTLMNQQGRILDRTRVLELIAGYPYLRRLICDRATIFHHRLTPAEKEDLERIFTNCDIEIVQI